MAMTFRSHDSWLNTSDTSLSDGSTNYLYTFGPLRQYLVEREMELSVVAENKPGSQRTQSN